MEESQAKIVTEWRAKWISQVFCDMVSRPKWKSAARNIRVGDLGHIKYERKLGHHMWHLARVVEVKPGEDGHVKTIIVEFCPHHIADRLKDYVWKSPNRLEIGVQRFSVLLAVEESDTTAQGACQVGDGSLQSPPGTTGMSLN